MRPDTGWNGQHAAFHSGGVYTHWRLKHHPDAGIAPGLFVFFAAAVAALRAGPLIALIGTAAFAALGVLLGMVLVRPAKPHDEQLMIEKVCLAQ